MNNWQQRIYEALSGSTKAYLNLARKVKNTKYNDSAEKLIDARKTNSIFPLIPKSEKRQKQRKDANWVRGYNKQPKDIFNRKKR